MAENKKFYGAGGRPRRAAKPLSNSLDEKQHKTGGTAAKPLKKQGVRPSVANEGVSSSISAIPQGAPHVNHVAMEPNANQEKILKSQGKVETGEKSSEKAKSGIAEKEMKSVDGANVATKAPQSPANSTLANSQTEVSAPVESDDSAELSANAESSTKGVSSGSNSGKASNSGAVNNRNSVPNVKPANQNQSVKPSDIQNPSSLRRGTEGLTLLGSKNTVYSDSYTPAILETFQNRHRENDYWVKFNCPEFTSLCPITGQPDFATIYISYIPDDLMVESKSLKLYLFGFRNHGAFHEDCVNIMMKDLIKLMSPRYIEVCGKFLPRGGISIDPYCNYGRPSTKFEEFAQKRLIMHDLSLERVDNR